MRFYTFFNIKIAIVIINEHKKLHVSVYGRLLGATSVAHAGPDNSR